VYTVAVKKVCRRTLIIVQGRESEREGSHSVFDVDVFFVLLLCIELSSDYRQHCAQRKSAGI